MSKKRSLEDITDPGSQDDEVIPPETKRLKINSDENEDSHEEESRDSGVDDEIAIGNPSDIWDMMDIDSEFEDLTSDEDEFGDIALEDDDVDDAVEFEIGDSEAVDPSNSGSFPPLNSQSHHTSHHLHIASQSTSTAAVPRNSQSTGFHRSMTSTQTDSSANQHLIDAVTPHISRYAAAKSLPATMPKSLSQQMVGPANDPDATDDEADQDDEDEYHDQQYRQYLDMGDERAQSEDGDDSEDENYEGERPARARRSKNHLMNENNAQKMKYSNQKKSRASAIGIDSYEQANSSFGVRRLRERSYHQPTEELEKIQEIVEKEFEAELTAKRMELKTIETNLEATRSMWNLLQDIWCSRIYQENIVLPRIKTSSYGQGKKRGRPSKEPTSKIAGFEAPPTINFDDNDPPKRRRKPEHPTLAKPIYARSESGFVQLICTNCHRALFGSRLGFLNHCRIVHSIKFQTWEDAVVYCGQPVEEHLVPSDDPCRLDIPIISLSSSKRDLNAPPANSLISTDSLSKQNATNLETTRFYIKKSVIVGNSSKHLVDEKMLSNSPLPELLRPAGDHPTHRWMIYVRPLQSSENLSNFISKVRFYLHPSFKPRQVVELLKPPFQICRESSKQWPVRVQIFFNDPRNKPISITHYVTFHPGLFEAVGDENIVELGINRDFTHNMILDRSSNSKSIANSASMHQNNMSEDPKNGNSEQENHTGHKTTPPQEELPSQSELPPTSSHQHHQTTGELLNRKPSIEPLESLSGLGHRYQPMAASVWGPTEELVANFLKETALLEVPLVSPSTDLILPYSYARSEEEWYQWTHGRRKASEWIRAQKLAQLLYERHQVKKSTREILDFCNYLQLTPPSRTALEGVGDQPDNTVELIPGNSDTRVNPISEYHKRYLFPLLRYRTEKIELEDVMECIRYCRFCGCIHFPYEKFDDLEIACAEKKLLVLQNTHSTYAELIERAQKRIQELIEASAAASAATTSSKSSSRKATETPKSVKTKIKKSETKAELDAPIPIVSNSTPRTRSKKMEISSTPASVIANGSSTTEPTGSNMMDIDEDVDVLEVSEPAPALQFSESPSTPQTAKRRGRPPKSSTNAIMQSSTSKFPDLHSGEHPAEALRDWNDSQHGLLLAWLKTVPIVDTRTNPIHLPDELIITLASLATPPFIIGTGLGPHTEMYQNLIAPKPQESTPSKPTESNSSSINNTKKAIAPASTPNPVASQSNIQNKATPKTPVSASKPRKSTLHSSSNIDASTLNDPSVVSQTQEEEEKISAAQLTGMESELRANGVDSPLSSSSVYLIIACMKAFAKKLTQGTIESYSNEKKSDPPEESKFKIVVPLHVATTIVQDPLRYDFLTNEGLARFTSAEMIQAQVLKNDLFGADIQGWLERKQTMQNQPERK